ncbi:MAG: acyltransferase [Candidatus Marinimicrobia bacterium]|nr:acyltransferase [Candidatus Neomarinimicrobiota bacterium]
MLIKRNKIPVKEILLIGIMPSFVKKLIYRIKGYKIGKNVSFSFGSVIIGKNVLIGDDSSFGFVSVVRGSTIDIGRFVTLGSLSMIDTETIIIGDDSRINENVIVGGIKTPDSMLKIGRRVIIMEYSFINPTKPIIIGDDCGIGGHCLLFTHGSWLSQLDGFPVTFAPITMGERVWLPWRVFIMPGVEIGNEVVVGANSLVSKSLPSNVLAAGSPAKIIVKNYPKPITREKRAIIFKSILSDFIGHLNYHDFVIKVYKMDSNSKKIEISKKKKSEIFIKIDDSEYSFFAEDNLLVVDSDSGIEGDYAMAIDLVNKKRIGTSDVGEEFVKFISRYGIRFDRLD